MAQTFDRYRILLTFGQVDIPAKHAAIMQILHDNLIHSNQLCMVSTGWAHDDQQPVAFMSGIELNFLTPKNTMTDVQILNIGNLLATAISERLVSIEKSDVLNITVP